MAQLQDLRNDIKAGKKIFELFEKAETAINELLAKEERAAELDTIISEKQSDADAARANLAELESKIDEVTNHAQGIIQKARQEADDIIKQAEKDASQIAIKALAENDEQSAKLQKIKEKISFAQARLKNIEGHIELQSKELQSITEKTDAAKEALSKALGTL